ncbi:hypothetical protein BOTBODRAFT_51878 [Botryobasidium botryosum FD-172 SS1]|uniref:Uncharacterized protein n=1 Tax=Botryobasidium botryosum (strain FD-172 SS1) TaxID=930990 RepID=A0A067N6T5_BOTB1|nr:hypothetical protein BOTBODRAFT_51878 [Botryobasidium botryosum FD-172 SS1]
MGVPPTDPQTADSFNAEMTAILDQLPDGKLAFRLIHTLLCRAKCPPVEESYIYTHVSKCRSYRDMDRELGKIKSAMDAFKAGDVSAPLANLLRDVANQTRPRRRNADEEFYATTYRSLPGSFPVEDPVMTKHGATVARVAMIIIERRMLVKLRRFRNRLVPIHRLPPELISSIFELTLEDLEDNLKLVRPNISFLRLAGVSAAWGVILRDTPRLWARMIMIPQALLHTFLLRAKAVPLEIAYRKMPKDSSAGMLCLAHHVNRARYLNLDIFGMSENEVMLWWYASTPVLEVLVLSGAWHMRSDEIPILPAPFGGIMPRLRELTLTRLCLPLDLPLYAGLTRLSLAELELTRPDSIHLLTQILTKCPHLEEFSLMDVHLILGLDQRAVEDAQPDINLPYLRRLFLGSLPHAVMRYLLSRIRPPPTAVLNLAPFLLPGEDLTTVLPSSVEHLPSFAAAEKLIVIVQPGGKACYIMGLTRSPTFTLVVHGSHGLFQKTFASFVQLVPMLYIESLSFRGLRRYKRDRRDSDAFAHALSYFSSVAVLTFHNCHRTFPETLAITPTRHLCPLLRGLIIDNSGIRGRDLIFLALSRVNRTLEDDSLELIPRFWYLELTGCPKLTPGLVEELARIVDMVVFADDPTPVLGE